MHRPDAIGTVSKYLTFSALTSSSSCSIVILYKSPSSLCRRKKKAPYKNAGQKIKKCKTAQTHLHFVHHSCYDNNRSATVTEWMLLPRNGNAMLRCVSVPVDNMVFCAHKYT